VERLRLRELLASPEEISRLRRTLQGGGVAAIPTETFYALASDPGSEAGVERIFRIKGRDDGKPLLVLFSERAQLEALGIAADSATLDTFFGIPNPLHFDIFQNRIYVASAVTPSQVSVYASVR